MRQLRFFIPVFVWAFNELKKALHDDDVWIRSLRNEIRALQRCIDELKGMPYTPDSIPEELVDFASRFAWGVARKLRSARTGTFSWVQTKVTSRRKLRVETGVNIRGGVWNRY